MTRIYLRIFIGFWLINIVTILFHNVWAHWFDLNPNRALVRYEDNPYDKFAVRGLHATVDSLIHWELDILRTGVAEAPDWLFQRVFIVDEYGYDLRARPIPPEVDEILGKISLTSPFYKSSGDEQSYAGRYILLPDGNNLRIVSFSTPFYGRRVLWQLYVINNWQFFLISILISGSVCFVFAHHMTRDFRAFREATYGVAKGDLGLRLSPTFGRRHDEIAELSRDFDNMTARLERSMAEQKRLIKDVSHELRSPLARIQFALGIAHQKSSDEVKLELDKASKAADYLNDIITTILSFPTTEIDSWDLDDVVDLKALLETVVNDFEEETKPKQLRLHFETSLDEALVATYSNTLVGVFENIIRNAIHYTKANSQIDIQLQSEGEDYMISICDQGPGVAEAELNDIFEPFYRTDQARDRSSGGYGLGLSIAQRTVELHKGHIKAKNRPDQSGLCVEINLPKSELF
ncbi:hypothetical protein NBRC116494_17020 [Aurantivibrio plasticivorans]